MVTLDGSQMMVQKLSLRFKIMLPMMLVIGLISFLLTFSNWQSMSQLIAHNEQAELKIHLQALENAIVSESRLAESMSSLVANMPQVQQKFAAGDRSALAGMFVPAFSSLKQKYGVDQFQFHTPPAVSFLRVHKPEAFGDDLSSFRFSVVDTNQSKRPLRGLESGVAGLGIRGIVPVFHQQQPIGSVEFGMNFGQSFFDQFKAHNQVDVAMYLYTDSTFKTVASTLTDRRPLFPESQLRQAFQGESQLAQMSINGVAHSVIAHPVKDYSGKAIGAVEIAMNNEHNIAVLMQERDKAIWFTLLVLVLAAGLSWLIVRYILNRLEKVVGNVKQIANGDLTHAIPVSGNDELAHLATAINDMRNQLHRMVQEVSENTRAVDTCAHEINEAIEGQAATASQMSSSVAEITSTMEELSASSTQIAEHSGLVVDVANQAMSNSYKGSEAMQTVLSRMEDIRNDNQASLQEIIELGNKSKQISKVMSLITNLADQTKLIAFNAALEASSAGEAGKRFSVVAAEIRRLADSVTDSTGEIESKINEIQDAISRLVINSEKGANSILAGTAASNVTAERFNEIVSAVNQTSTAAQQISLSTQQQKVASNQVVVALREIVTASSHTAGSINKIAQISQDMTQLSETLAQLTHQFKLVRSTEA